LSSIGKNGGAPINLPHMSESSMSSKDLDRLNKLYENFPSIEKALEAVTERVDITENRHDATDKNVSDIFKTLKIKADISMKDDIAKLGKSIDAIFRELDQFNTLRNEIDANKKRCEANDRTLALVEERLDMLKDSVSERLREIEILLNSLKEELKKVDTEENRQGGLIIQITQKINTLEIKIDNMKSSPGEFVGGGFGSSTSGGNTKELRGMVDQLRRDFLNYKEETYKKDIQIEAELNRKVDKSDLVEFERLMRERMEAEEKALQKAKNEFKKGMKIFDDRVKRVTDQVKSRGPSLERDDAMLTKKPLEGLK
jgi:chromosome segregation ATPase